LDILNNNLSGWIPPDLGALTDLEVLELSRNSLTGPIPSELGTLSNLWKLQLTLNDLTVSNGSTEYSGAGIYSYAGQVTLRL